MSLSLDETHDPARQSWVEGADGHPDFPIQNLPLGVFTPLDGGRRRIGCAIGDQVLDLAALADAGVLPGATREVLAAEALNPLLAAEPAVRGELRRHVSDLLSGSRWRAAAESHLRPAAACRMHLPAVIGDYTDFYAGIHHATSIGALFRPDSPLLPNYKHVPIGYHGRASSVRESGTPVVRPHGQSKSSDDSYPSFGPSRRLDYELELGVWIGGINALGRPTSIEEAGGRVAGLCLLNDWSARDLQAWEYQPLGPFLAKSFATTVSPWLVTAEALAPFRISQPRRPEDDPTPLPYLWNENDQEKGAFALELTATLETAVMRDAAEAPFMLSRGTFAEAAYWTVAQLVAHHSSNGCDLRPGDLLGTGTLSAAAPEGAGSLMELARNGAASLILPNGERRAFLEDEDEVSLSARADAPGRVGIGFGPCVGRVLAATTIV